MKKTIMNLMVAIFAATATPALAENHTQHNVQHTECTCAENKHEQCKDTCECCKHCCTTNKSCPCCNESNNCKNCQNHNMNTEKCSACEEHCNNCEKQCLDCQTCKCCEHKKGLFSKLKFW